MPPLSLPSLSLPEKEGKRENRGDSLLSPVCAVPPRHSCSSHARKGSRGRGRGEREGRKLLLYTHRLPASATITTLPLVQLGKHDLRRSGERFFLAAARNENCSECVFKSLDGCRMRALHSDAVLRLVGVCEVPVMVMMKFFDQFPFLSVFCFPHIQFLRWP